VTASEFAFLALGLVLGTAAGAAFIVVLRARPPSPREVRVTMAPRSIPTRSVTLAVDPFQQALDGPAPGGPGDRRAADRPERHADGDELDPIPLIRRPALVPLLATADAQAASPFAVGSRTSVLMAVPAVRLEPSPSTGGPVALAAATTLVDAPTAATGHPGMAVTEPGDADPTTERRDADPSPTGRPGASEGALDHRPATVAAPVVTIVASSTVSEDGDPVAHPPGDADPRPAGPCEALRAVAQDRCAVAERAGAAAEAALGRLRDAQRAYDEASQQADDADALADPRAVRAAKEAAQHTFRSARARAGSREDLETAARTWLQEINRINGESREAARLAATSRATANDLVTSLERLTTEADGARVAHEMAEEACVAARQAVADCEEAETLAAAAAVAAAASSPEPTSHFPDDEPELSVIQTGVREARMMRLVRGDRSALERTVAELAGDDPTERRRWQVALTGLVDAIVACAIDASAIDVPDEPAFWEPFSARQRREIVAALASLGYRFDGLGGFADGRVPSQRDLSLAVGYAGLDPMRIRRWPTEADARELLAHADVAADEYLAGAAGGMTLSELIDLLGRRADGLTDLWNDWGRVRGQLLATD
jgi:hypothetical protein